MVSATERLERSYINRRFREEGLQCHRDAVEYLLGPARRAGGDGDAELEPIEEVVDRMLLLLDVRQLGGEAAVSREMLEGAVGALDATTASDEDLIVVPADQCPRIVYDQVRKAFHRDDAGEPRVLSASAGAKAALYRQRLLLVLQRLLRNRIFTRPDVDFGPSMAREHCELVPVQALLGTVGERQFALGCLSKLDDGGGVCLEDLTGAVPLALDGLKEDVAPGLYPENSIVVVEGELRHDGVFAVDAMVQPPAEAQVDSKAAAHGLDFFGGGHVSAEARARWDEGGGGFGDGSDARVAVLAGVWMDAPGTAEALRAALREMEASPPAALVLMGDFVGNSSGGAGRAASAAATREALAAIGRIVAQEFKSVAQNTRVIVMPGPRDPGPGRGLLPRPPLAPSLAGGLLHYLPRAELTSNPCRMRLLGREIVVFRHDLMHRMRRLSVTSRTDMGAKAAPETHLGEVASVLLSQAHLVPLPLAEQPIVWEMDHALRLYPMPDALLLGDSGQAATYETPEGCVAVGAGSFTAHGTYAEYWPLRRTGQRAAVRTAKA